MSDTLKVCSRQCHVLPATTQYFYKDKARPDGLDVWCKDCRKEHLRSRPRFHRSDKHTGPIVLTLPVSRQYPATQHFSSSVRKMSDNAVKAGRDVVVTTIYHNPVWRWRKWIHPRWKDLDSFFKESLNL